MGGDGDTGLEWSSKDLERQHLCPYTTYSLYHYSSYFTCILNIHLSSLIVKVFKKILAVSDLYTRLNLACGFKIFSYRNHFLTLILE